MDSKAIAGVLAFLTLAGCGDDSQPTETATRQAPDPGAIRQGSEGRVAHDEEGPQAEARSAEPSRVDAPEPLDLDDVAAAAPPPPIRESRIRRLREGEEVPTYAPFIPNFIAPDLIQEGLPGVSSDGSLLAVPEESGTEWGWTNHLRIFRVADGGAEETFRTAWGDIASEESEGPERERELQRMRQQGRRASLYLSAHGFRSMHRIPTSEETPLRGVPVLVWDGENTSEVVIRDSGSTTERYRALPLGQPRRAPVPDDEDDTDRCYTAEIEDLSAWWAPTANAVLMRAIYNPAADECDQEIFYDVVRLR